MKRAEISIETIVIAVLVLLVLIVVSAIFINQSKDANTTLSTCALSGGECTQGATCTTTALVGTCEAGNVCCAERIGS
ncbi:MAG: hypothetical protein ACI8Y7_000923 [Candidatus Woesearchaeota archaeon]|jgi:hypothetical protein